MRSDIPLIEEENPREAEGVCPFDTNDALAERDYSVKCIATRCIVIVKGYWIWWCSTHHQPMFMCEKARMKKKIFEVVKK